MILRTTPFPSTEQYRGLIIVNTLLNHSGRPIKIYR